MKIRVSLCRNPMRHLENVRRLFDVNDYDENVYPAIVAYIKRVLGESLDEWDNEMLAIAELFLTTGEWGP
jgi:hypothetical protein